MVVFTRQCFLNYMCSLPPSPPHKGGGKQRWVPLPLEPPRPPSKGSHRDRQRDRDRDREGGDRDHGSSEYHGRHERGDRERDRGRDRDGHQGRTWRSDRDRYHPPPRYMHSEYSGSYGHHEGPGDRSERGGAYGGGGGAYQGPRGGRGSRGRNWRYPPPGAHG